MIGSASQWLANASGSAVSVVMIITAMPLFIIMTWERVVRGGSETRQSSVRTDISCWITIVVGAFSLAYGVGLGALATYSVMNHQASFSIRQIGGYVLTLCFVTIAVGAAISHLRCGED